MNFQIDVAQGITLAYCIIESVYVTSLFLCTPQVTYVFSTVLVLAEFFRVKSTTLGSNIQILGILILRYIKSCTYFCGLFWGCKIKGYMSKQSAATVWAQAHWRFITFPIILLILLVTLSACKVNGSSVSTFNFYLNGNKYKDNNLLFGIPRGVRGDEWQVATPNLVSQAKNNFPTVNNDIGYGQDMSTILDVPYKSWSTLLRPWDVGYFFMSLETAFAFQWWVMLFSLGLVVYLLALSILPRKYLFASLAAIFVMTSPMIQWWYRSYLIMTVASGLAALLIALKLSAPKLSNWHRFGLSLLLGYVFAVFVFIQYPPFQIMTGLPVALFYIGYLLKHGVFAKINRRDLLLILVSISGGAVIAELIIGVYYDQHSVAIGAILHSLYPASRTFPSGQGTLSTFMHLFANPFQAELQGATQAALNYWQNQSEATLFIGFAGLLILPAALTSWSYYKREHRIRWDLLMPIAGILLIYTYIFVPGLTELFKLLYFTSIPANRFALGIGLLEFLLLLLLAKEYYEKPLNTKLVGGCVAITAILFITAGLYTTHMYPGYIHGGFIVVIGASLWMAGVLWLLLTGRRELALTMLVVISLVSTFKVNPLYRGLSPLTDTRLATAIQDIVKSDPNARWISTVNTLETYPPANGAKSITGYYSYAQMKLWQQVDPDQNLQDVYNRTAHVVAQISNSNSLVLTSGNHFTFDINPCSALPSELNVKYVLTTQREVNSCLALQQQLNFSARNVYIYKITSAAKRKTVATQATSSTH